MEQNQKNKHFIIEYVNALSGIIKTRESIEKYVSDNNLIEHILFFDSVLPRYELIIDEITAEDDRVVIMARIKGKHEGEFNGMPPTYKNVEFAAAVGYHLENDKIVSHWLIADQLSLLEQLGVSAVPA
jgi:hypothetical protein